MSPTTLARVACFAACLSLPACLLNSGIVTGNLSYVYVPEEAADVQQLLIAGTTASVPALKPFTIDVPMVYDAPTTAADGTVTESKLYTNVDGDELEFIREYDAGSDQWWESVEVRPKNGGDFTLVRLKGFLGTDRGNAWGIYY